MSTRDSSAWMDRLACRDQTVNADWFTADGTGADAEWQRERAKGVCRGCEVIDACLTYALAHNVAGIWGATDDKERGNLKQNYRRHQRKAVASGANPLKTSSRIGAAPGGASTPSEGLAPPNAPRKDFLPMMPDGAR